MYAYKLNLQQLRVKGNVGTLTQQEEETMHRCTQALSDLDSQARFVSRCHALKDQSCMSKNFFQKLGAKCNRDYLVKIEKNDALVIQDDPSTLRECTEHFGATLSIKPTHSQALEVPKSTILSFVNLCTESSSASCLDSLFEEAEIFCSTEIR